MSLPQPIRNCITAGQLRNLLGAVPDHAVIRAMSPTELHVDLGDDVAPQIIVIAERNEDELLAAAPAAVANDQLEAAQKAVADAETALGTARGELDNASESDKAAALDKVAAAENALAEASGVLAALEGK